MTRHLQACLPDEADADDTPPTVLGIAGEHGSDYLLHVLVDSETAT